MTEVKSDGGSSKYYELPVPQYLVDHILAQIEAGEQPTMETGDIIKMLVNNDFDMGNIIKAQRRIYMAKMGLGKKGTEIEYDLRKTEYFTSEIRRTL